ncbi:MAG TPA: hypothetical protein VGF28_16515 [Thermoanaerobaculia bacterium]
MRFAIALALVSAVSLIGFSLLPSRPRARFVVPLSLSFGALVVGSLTWIVGTLIGTSAAMIAAALLFAVSLRHARAWGGAVQRFGRELLPLAKQPASILTGLLLLTVLRQLALPLIDSDGLRYHAALPKLFLLQGEVTYYPWDVTGAYPQTAEMLYMLGIAAWSGEVAKVIHFLFFSATLATLALTVHRGRATRTAAALAPFLYAAAPVALLPAGSAFIDHIVVFHVAVALQLVLAVSSGRTGSQPVPRRPERPALQRARVALPLAAAFATKITAAPAIAVLALARKRVRSIAVIAAVVTLAFLPFAIRNVYYTGDPVYPVGRGLLGLPIAGVTQERIEYATQFHGKIGGIPWVPREGVVQDDEVAGLHHLLGLFALLLAIRDRRLRVPLLIVVAYLAVGLVYSVPTRHYLSMFLVLSIFEALALARLRRFAPVVALLVALPALAVSVPLVLTYGSFDVARTVPAYRAMQVVNAQPPGGKVMGFDVPAPYYFDRPWIVEGLLNEPPLKRWVREARTVEDLLAKLRAHDVRYVVVTPGYGGGGPHTLVALAENPREAQLLDALRRRLRPVERVDSVDVFAVP